jgi:hypothetical protein
VILKNPMSCTAPFDSWHNQDTPKRSDKPKQATPHDFTVLAIFLPFLWPPLLMASLASGSLIFSSVVWVLSPVVVALALGTVFWDLVTGRLSSWGKLPIGLLVSYLVVFVYLVYQVVAFLLTPYRGI